MTCLPFSTSIPYVFFIASPAEAAWQHRPNARRGCKAAPLSRAAAPPATARAAAAPPGVEAAAAPRALCPNARLRPSSLASPAALGAAA
jgi:hypothetical protein